MMIQYSQESPSISTDVCKTVIDLLPGEIVGRRSTRIPPNIKRSSGAILLTRD